jgi:hypothetical protein
MKTAADVGRYRFRVSAAFNHSLEIYRVDNVFIQVIRGTIMLDDDGNLSDNYSMTDFVQIERHISVNNISKWKYSKAVETSAPVSSLIMPFSGFVDNVNIIQAGTDYAGEIVFDRVKNKFVHEVNSSGSGPFGAMTYYAEWIGRENYSDTAGTPHLNKIYVVGGILCIWNGTEMIEHVVSENQRPEKMWVGLENELPENRQGTNTLYYTY